MRARPPPVARHPGRRPARPNRTTGSSGISSATSLNSAIRFRSTMSPPPPGTEAAARLRAAVDAPVSSPCPNRFRSWALMSATTARWLVGRQNASASRPQLEPAPPLQRSSDAATVPIIAGGRSGRLATFGKTRSRRASVSHTAITLQVSTDGADSGWSWMPTRSRPVSFTTRTCSRWHAMSTAVGVIEGPNVSRLGVDASARLVSRARTPSPCPA
jgi:hypothetical protein